MFVRPLILDAGLTAQEASARLAVHAAKAFAVIRRVAGHEVLFHLLELKAVQDAVTSVAADQTLETALRLVEKPPARLRQMNQAHNLDLEPLVPEILVDGFEVVGALVPAAGPQAAAVSAPRASAAANPPAPAVSAPAGPRIEQLKRPLFQPPRGTGEGKEVLHYKRFLGIKIYPTGGVSHPSGPSIVQVASASVQAAVESSQVQKNASVMVSLDAPTSVAGGGSFNLRIKFSRVIREKLGIAERVAQSVREAGRNLLLQAQVIANRFEAPDAAQKPITVPLGRPEEGNLSVPLVAPAAGNETNLARLMVLFSAGGQFTGAASHRMVVAQSGKQPALPRAASDRLNWLEPSRPQPLWEPPNETPADLSVILVRDEPVNSTRERYQLRFVSPHPIKLPSGLSLSLDRDAATFALELIKDVNLHQADVLVSNVLKAQARKIAGLLPAAFWDVLSQTWNHVQATGKRVPTVLWVSSEHHIPWELCYLEQPLEVGQPPFLGAQVALGRWVLSEGNQPQPWPYQHIAVDKMAVMIGDYAAESGLRPLPHAREEGEALEKQFQAKRFTVSTRDLKRLVDGQLSETGQSAVVQVVHFACHGEAAPTVIYLDQGTPFTPVILESADWPKTAHPFLFMNACQVGNAGEFLGECAGFAGSSLRAGFAGFLAPLWSVVDEDAKAFALRFYELAFSGDLGSPLPIGEILRRLRAGYNSEAEKPRVTPMAYVFYGNPALRLSRSPSVGTEQRVDTARLHDLGLT